MPRRRPSAQVVSLSEARLARRLHTYRERLDQVLRSNRRAIGRLFTSGALFTRVGARAGRELLAAHEQLMRVLALLHRLANEGDVPPPRRPREVDAIFAELDTLLASTALLAEQTSGLLGGLKKE